MCRGSEIAEEQNVYKIIHTYTKCATNKKVSRYMPFPITLRCKKCAIKEIAGVHAYT